MGCFKLTYNQYDTALKVVHRDIDFEQNTVQRFLSLDPLMEQFPWMSPFVGFDNNPILYVDPYGLSSQDGRKGQEEDDKKKQEEPKEEKKRSPDGITEGGEFPTNPNLGDIHGDDNSKFYTFKKDGWKEIQSAKVDNSKSKEKTENKKKGYDWLKGDYTFGQNWGQISGRKISYEQNALVQQYTNFGNKVIGGSFGMIGAVPAISYGILTAPVWAPLLINTGGSGYLINSIGRTSIDATAQVTVNGFNNLDVFDAFASGFLTPTGSALLGGSFDFKPFSFEDKYRLVGINKSLAESTIDIGVKYTFGRTGIVGKQTSKLSTQFTSLKAPQLTFIINAPFVLTGKLVNKQIKSTLK